MQKKPQDVIPLEGSSDSTGTPPTPSTPTTTDSKFQARKSLPREAEAITTPPSPEDNSSPTTLPQEMKKPPSLRVNRKSTGSYVALKDVFGTLPTTDTPTAPVEGRSTTNVKLKTKANLINVGGVKLEMPSTKTRNSSTSTPTTKGEDIFSIESTTSSEDQTDELSSTSIDDEASLDDKPQESDKSPVLTPIPNVSHAVSKRLIEANTRKSSGGGTFIEKPITRQNSGNISSRGRERRISEANLVIENPLKYIPEGVETATYDISNQEILELYHIRLTTKTEAETNKSEDENIVDVFTDEPESSESLEDFIHNLKMLKNDTHIDNINLPFRHFSRNPLYNPQKARDINLDACFTLEETVRYNEVILRIIEGGLDPNNHVIFQQEWDNSQNDKLSAQQRSAILARKTTTSRRYSRAVAAVLLRSASLQPKDIEDITRLHTPEKILKVEQESHYSLATCSPSWKVQLKNKRQGADGANLNNRCAYQPEWQTQLQRTKLYKVAATIASKPQKV